MQIHTYLFPICLGSIQKTWGHKRILPQCEENTPLPSMGRSRVRPGTIKQRLRGLQQVKQLQKQLRQQPDIRKIGRPLPPVKNLIRLFRQILNIKNVCNSNRDLSGKKNKTEAVTVSVSVFIWEPWHSSYLHLLALPVEDREEEGYYRRSDPENGYICEVILQDFSCGGVLDGIAVDKPSADHVHKAGGYV